MGHSRPTRLQWWCVSTFNLFSSLIAVAVDKDIPSAQKKGSGEKPEKEDDKGKISVQNRYLLPSFSSQKYAYKMFIHVS